MHERIRERFEACWPAEPAELKALQAVSRPPGGHFPCLLYANFNLFWASEVCSVTHARISEGNSDVAEATAGLAGLLQRFALRLAKWKLDDTATLLNDVASWCVNTRPDASQALAVLDALILYLNRVQNWVDRSVPWFQMDEQLSVLPVEQP